MIVLAIDTAGVDCSAAVFDSEAGRVLAEVTDMIGKGHAERLMAVIDEALEKAGRDLKEVERIAVVTGPGSFTGIRVGVAAARGLALALNADCVGVTTLETLAAQHFQAGGSAPVLAAMDAKRGEVYVQAFSADESPLSESRAMTHAEATGFSASLAGEVVGSGRAVILGESVASPAVDRFDIATVARLGATRPASTGRPRPVYLRGPDAKPQAGYALARA
jgi:tRNA threonylcarbamoyladenosine biosynthesis protein TsaB